MNEVFIGTFLGGAACAVLALAVVGAAWWVGVLREYRK